MTATTPSDIAAALGFGSLDLTSRRVDWSRWDEQTGAELYEVITPKPMPAHWEEYDEFTDWRETYEDEDEARDAFNDSDVGAEWRDGFAPMMNFVWPVFLGHEPNAEEIAAKMEEAGGCVSLIDFSVNEDHEGERFGIALTGGGMDLSWNIAAAYCAAGQVPPVALLRNMDRTTTPTIGEHWARVVAHAMGRAAESLEMTAQRLAVKSGELLNLIDTK
jgi:hypothetical protein